MTVRELIFGRPKSTPAAWASVFYYVAALTVSTALFMPDLTQSNWVRWPLFALAILALLGMRVAEFEDGIRVQCQRERSRSIHLPAVKR